MPLKQRLFSITEPQEKWLLARATQLGVSHAELMRRILDAARGEIGELETTKNRVAVPDQLLAPVANIVPTAQPPTERAAAISELIRYCHDNRISENRIITLLRERMDGGDWRQAGAVEYRAVLDALRSQDDLAHG